MDQEIEAALESYWCAAYNEGKYDLATDDSKAQAALNRIRARVAELETEARQAREFIAAIIIGNGGEITVPESAFVEVGPKTIVGVTRDHENRVTRLWVK
jgi:flagellar basal body rod protein FlgF